MSIATSFFVRTIETAKIFKKEPFWGQTLQILWDHVGQKIKKMVLTNIVQDAILYLKMIYQHLLQKFPYPTLQAYS